MEPVTTSLTALNQMLEVLSRSLTVEAARALAGIQIDPHLDARIEELACRCNEGLLTEAERVEYDSYVEGAEILHLIRLKARRFLTDRGAA